MAKKWTYDNARNFSSPPMFTAATLRYHKDAVGIELEQEFPAEMQNAVTEYKYAAADLGCKIVNDGSLRGVGIEVITKPLVVGEALSVVEKLYTYLKNHNIVLNKSHRTSTHVHLNFTKYDPVKILQFVALYFYLEEGLTLCTTVDRRSNVFCSRSIGNIAKIVENIKSKKAFWYSFNNEDFNKYASLNFATYPRIGTIESRLFQGEPDYDKVNDWVHGLASIKALSTSFNSLRALEQYLIDTPCTKVLRDACPSLAPTILRACKEENNPIADIARRGYALTSSLFRMDAIYKENADFLEEWQKKDKIRQEELQKLLQKEEAPPVNWERDELRWENPADPIEPPLDPREQNIAELGAFIRALQNQRNQQHIGAAGVPLRGRVVDVIIDDDFE